MKKFLAVVLVLIALLFGATFTLLTVGAKARHERYIKSGDVLGSAVFVNHISYTLNYSQQKKLLYLINHAKLSSSDVPFTPTSTIEKIAIYRFNAPPLVIVPDTTYTILALQDQEKNFIKVATPSKLGQLIESSYDR